MTPLVLLHGFLGCAEDWAALRSKLEPDVECEALDLPGHGRDPIAVDATCFDEGVTQVQRMIEGRGIERCHLLGYSMGGRLALGVLARAPHLVESAIAIGASAGIADDAGRQRRRETDEALAARLEREDLADFVDRWYDQDLFAPLRQSAAFAAVRARRLQGQPPALAAALRALGTGSQRDLEGRLSGSTARILLLAGALDAKYVSLNEQLAARCPPIDCRTVPGCGHSPHLEDPSELARIVFDSLAQHQD